MSALPVSVLLAHSPSCQIDQRKMTSSFAFVYHFTQHRKTRLQGGAAEGQHICVCVCPHLMRPIIQL